MECLKAKHYDRLMTSMSQWKKLAVVIPTMNRSDFINRSVRWYGQHGISAYIGDSSQYHNCAPTLFSHVLHTPGANEMKASYLASRDSTAEYIAWAGDDDFLLPSALQAACEILDAHPELTSVAGHAVIFATVHNGVWNPIESVVGAYPDHFFRVFRREIITDAWAQVIDLPTAEPDADHVYGAYVRSVRLLEILAQTDTGRTTIDMLSLLRQVHPGRVTSIHGIRDPLRTRLGHRFPRLQYLKQRLVARCWHVDGKRGRCLNCELMLPSLRRKDSPYCDFQAVERFLETGVHHEERLRETNGRTSAELRVHAH